MPVSEEEYQKLLRDAGYTFKPEKTFIGIVCVVVGFIIGYYGAAPIAAGLFGYPSGSWVHILIWWFCISAPTFSALDSINKKNVKALALANLAAGRS